MQKFEETGSTEDRRHEESGSTPTVRTPATIQRVHEHFQANPRSSLRRAAQEVGISRESLRRITVEDLSLHAYKIQVHQPLTERDENRRLDFSNLMIEKLENRAIDIGQIWFSDEAHFHLNGYVNKQNYRFWATENPFLAISRPLHPQRVTVWCAMTAEGIIGPIFLTQDLDIGRCLRKNLFQ